MVPVMSLDERIRFAQRERNDFKLRLRCFVHRPVLRPPVPPGDVEERLSFSRSARATSTTAATKPLNSSGVGALGSRRVTS